MEVDEVIIYLGNMLFDMVILKGSFVILNC